MTVPRLVLQHARLIILSFLRSPAYLIPTLIMPALFYSVFALSRAHGQNEARIYLASYAAFSVVGVSLFQFGAGIAIERQSPWERTMRLLPVGASTRIVARLLASLFFCSLSLVCLFFIAGSFGSIQPSPSLYMRLTIGLLTGIIPITLLGISLGYWVDAKSALPICNAIYFPLAYLGGLFGPLTQLQTPLARLSYFLPTRHFAEIVWASVLGQGFPLTSILALTAFSVLFAASAFVGYERDYAQRYG